MAEAGDAQARIKALEDALATAEAQVSAYLLCQRTSPLRTAPVLTPSCMRPQLEAANVNLEFQEQVCMLFSRAVPPVAGAGKNIPPHRHSYRQHRVKERLYLPREQLADVQRQQQANRCASLQFDMLTDHLPCPGCCSSQLARTQLEAAQEEAAQQRSRMQELQATVDRMQQVRQHHSLRAALDCTIAACAGRDKDRVCPFSLGPAQRLLDR